MCLVGSDAQTGRTGIRLTGQEAEQHSLTPALQGCQRQLAITNTIFCLANERKILWTHSRSERWHLADNHHCLLANLRPCASDHNWKLRIPGNNTIQRSHNQLSAEHRNGRHAQGLSNSNDPKGTLGQGFPVKREMHLPECYEAGHFLRK